MRMLKFLIIIFLGVTIDSSIHGQNIEIPEWLKGTWNNSAESNSNNFEYWTFSNDSIYVIKGFPINKSNRICLNKQYSDYKFKTETTDSLFRINFIKDIDSVVYEFIIKKVSYSDVPVLTYSIVINGEIKRQHSISCNLVLTK